MKSVFSLLAVIILVGCGQGPAGQTGSQGAPGLPGDSVTGPAGADGTQITPVQFCIGTPVYPSTFPETGLCINNQIYAVYSVNDGFLTLIPPGAYSSDGVNSSCNFTVLPNCQIQN
jgi:hypothetical protein